MVDLNSPMDVQCAGFCFVFCLFLEFGQEGLFCLRLKKLRLTCGMKDETLTPSIIK